ncbi:MAG: excinuclease ABC subunit UvrC, partial [Luteimonas sp.]|nr:excinuclease ABC subunit UvrC [Luteimonas sp.]
MAQPPIIDRFSEETATFTVRGNEKPDLETGVAAIRNVLRTLPQRPGVYRMTDADGGVLYVGKARHLKSRVTNYTQVTRLPRRLQRMVAQTRDMTIVTTNSESEALLLEAQLIKRFRPAYNVLLRDDKSFPFIFLREDHGFPRIAKHRGARVGKGVFYGPFASAGAVNTTLNALQKVFLLRSCSDSFFANRSRPCLLHQIRRCSAPCVGRIDEDGYAELVGDAKAFLSGKSQETQKKLGAAMQAAAEAMDFELAAVFRDRLRALTYIQGSQTVHSEGLGDGDIFALAGKGGAVCIQAFFIRGGQNWGHRSFFPAHTNDVPEDEVLTGFLMQFYEDVPPPRRILLDRALPEAALVAEALSVRATSKVEIDQPQRGPRKKLIDQARRNAEEALERRLAEGTTQGKLLRELAEVFELPEPPNRIEVYDNSHIMGTNATGDDTTDADIVALACKAGVMCIQMFFIRGGQNWGHRSFFPAHTNDVAEDEVLTAFLAQFYEDVPAPRAILIDRTLSEMALVADALSERAGKRVGLRHAQRGPDRQLVAQARRNAEEALERRLAEATTQGQLMRELAELFDLAETPARIEVYD